LSGAEIPIVRPAAVTPAWLSLVLGRAGHAVTVKNFDARRVGSGQVGESVRFTLSFEGEAVGAPASIVGKFPSADDVSRATGVGLGNYIREVNFYRELASTALVTTPICLFADVDPQTSEFVLMMEDLAPAEQGDQIHGLSLERVELALDEAAKLHASHWNDAAMDDLAWLSDSRAAPAPLSGSLMAELWAGFKTRYGGRVDADCRRIGDAISASYNTFKHGYVGPKCLIHNDFRPDNMMFATAPGGYPAVILDWQSIGVGCCMADVSYFLGGALSAPQRRANERRLLEGYLITLQSLGVRDYTWGELWRDYRRYSFSLFIMAFAASMIVERTTRGDEMFFAMLEGGASHVLDLDAIALLGAG
jgi:Phosphotransferase enzyme family